MTPHVHMIGIGGVGMSALAQLYCTLGYTVSGSDRSNSPTTALLEKKGVAISYSQEKGSVPDAATLVVYSDAVGTDNPERVEAVSRNIRQQSYFEALGEALSDREHVIAVSGTHGKTTTSAMLAKALKDLHKNPGAIIGSLVPQFEGNYLDGDGPFVVEACEYKDHLLQLSPHVLVITNLEWDHSDHFASLEAVQETFKKAVARVPEEGFVVANTADPNVIPVLEGAKATVVDYRTETVPKLQILGSFNESNARAAKAAVTTVFPEAAASDIDASLASFSGTWRRFEFKGKTKEGFSVFDDYAHHPTAVRETLSAVRKEHVGERILVAFHPHLYTRTRDFMDAFAEALALADEVILAPIYPARETPIEGVSSDVLAKKIEGQGTKATSCASLDEVFEEVTKKLADANGSLIFITMGAGDIYKVADKVIV